MLDTFEKAHNKVKQEKEFVYAVTSENFLHTRLWTWRLDGHIKDKSDLTVIVYGSDTDGTKISLARLPYDQAMPILDALGLPNPHGSIK